MPEPYHHEYRISPTVLPLPDDRPGAVPWAVQTAVSKALEALYAESHAKGAPFSHGHVDQFTLRFHAGEWGEMLVTVEAQVSERRERLTAAQMEADITRLLATRREAADG